MKMQRGFTLIELVMVIVILGVLAAMAMPKFVDLQTDAKKAKAEGVAGAIASSASIQYAASKITGTYSAASACASAAYLQPASFPSGCSATGSTSCTVTCDGESAAVVNLPE